MKNGLVIGLILVLAFILRVWQIDKFPAGFTADEAAQGYTAYSILTTSKDEWGVKFPFTPRSFGDFKPPLYTYLAIPSVALLGLDEFAVRLPLALLGTLAVLVTYLLVKKLFHSSLLAFLSALFLATSPWHISFSRGAFEENLPTLFFPLGLYLFLKGLENQKFLIFAAIVFGLNLFSSHSARLITPLFFIFLLWWKRREFLLKGRGIAAILIFIIFLGTATISFMQGGGTRIADIGIFSAGFDAPKLFVNSYLSYFSVEFLFTRGAGEATYGMIPGQGVLYLFELLFLIFTFVVLVRKWNINFLPILALLILAPIPAALAFGVGYHANRVVAMMPTIQILSAYGAIASFDYFRKWLPKLILLFFYSFIFLFFLVSFLWNYFSQAPKISAPAMFYGWKEAMSYISSIENKYPKIIVSRRFSEPQIFVAFYKKWDPVDFQKESYDWLRYQKQGLKFVDQLGTYSLGKYEFRNITWSKDRDLKNTLVVGREEDFPQTETLIKRIIPYPDGKPAFLIVERP